MDARVYTTDSYVEQKRQRPSGKLTQDCIRSLVHKGIKADGTPIHFTGTYNQTSEVIKPGRRSNASARSTLALAGSSSKTKRFVRVQHGTDARMDMRPLPASAKIKHNGQATCYRDGSAATDASNGMGLASRVKARG